MAGFADRQAGDADVAAHHAVDLQFAIAGDVALDGDVGRDQGRHLRGRPARASMERDAVDMGRGSILAEPRPLAS
jgi:hypothetical protein